MSERTPSPVIAQGFALLEYLMSGRTLAEAMGCSRESQEALYSMAFTCYGQAKYTEAMRVFAFLMTANHLDRRFYSGFAACLQMQGRHEEAINYYGIASLLNQTDPAPPMHVAECQLALGNHDRARASIEYALCQARGHEAHHGFVPRLEAMLSFLKEQPEETCHG